MGFKILDNQGKAINNSDLDKEACLLWGIEVDERYYGSPYEGERRTTSWFDVIGWKIHFERLTTWKAVKNSIRNDYLEDRKELGDGLYGVKYMLEAQKPMFDLIYHWRNKGYKPVPHPVN